MYFVPCTSGSGFHGTPKRNPDNEGLDQDNTSPHSGPMQTLFSVADLDRAMSLVHSHMSATPTLSWPILNQEVGASVFVKHEDGTPTGAFKVRGGLVYMERLRRERPDVAGVISATRGNHGISLSYAGRAYAVPVVIVVPEGNGAEKNAMMRSLGAEVIVHGEDFQAARMHSMALAGERGLEAVPPFHLDLVLGVATYARELFESAGPLDAVYVPIGMGSGICGLIATRDVLGLTTEIIGVGADGAPAASLSFAAGHVVSTPTAKTFADGVATREPDPTAAAIIRAGASRVVSVSDDECADAIRLLWRTTHHLAEPAGAIAIAGLCSERAQMTGRRIGVVLSGSNMDTAIAADVLAGRTPAA
jgi:threonine dehydratase